MALSAPAARTFPLLTHAGPDSLAAYRGAIPVTAGRLLADARRLAERLGGAEQILNLCTDRYLFAVGLAASLMTGRASLLPAAHAPSAIRELRSFGRNMLCLTDDPLCDVTLPRLLVDIACTSAAAGSDWQVPEIGATQLAAFIFTSGSTGAPVPHAKTWGSLVTDVRCEAQQLGMSDGQSRAIVGTVPAQHMFGFETTVLAPLQTGNILCNARPFFPADVAATLAALPAPRVLVSTPVHLRALLDSQVAFPILDRVVSSTAPLAPELARAVEQRLGCPLLEIYGSTETGQIASRRTSQSDQWQLSPDVRLVTRDGCHWVEGGHVETPTQLTDRLEIVDSRSFLLRGRSADLVNVAGKRSSLMYLTHQLCSIAGVVDGTFFHPHSGEGGALPGQVTRLAAAVVAPGCDASFIQQQLRLLIDPAFLPRPLLLVERLPRDATGKLPHAELQALLIRKA